MAILDSQPKYDCTIQINLFKKRDRTFRMTIQNEDVGDITGSSLWMSVKEQMGDEDSESVIIKRNTEAGGSDSEAKVIDGENRIVEFYIVPSDTEDLSPGEYFADAVIMLPSGRKFQLADPFLFSLKQPITLT